MDIYIEPFLSEEYFYNFLLHVDAFFREFPSVLPLATFIIGIISVFCTIKNAELIFKKKPKVKLSLLGPDFDAGNQYWHIQIKNGGTSINKGALFLVGFKENKNQHFIPHIRFQWPYEQADNNRPAERSLGKLEFVNFFSTEDNGKLHLCLTPTKIKLPTEPGKFIDIAVQVMGENYHGKKQWIRIRQKDGWHLIPLNGVNQFLV